MELARTSASFDREKIMTAVRLILEAIGEDPERPGLIDTPRRVADAYMEICAGIGQDEAEQISVVFDNEQDEMIVVKDIPFYSLCEHHLLPFSGHAHVAYVPKEGKITGLSKLARVVDVASRRLQIQERLTGQIANAVEKKLNAAGVLVVVEAEHLCMTMRGIKKPGSLTVTSAIRGLFRRNPAARAEAMALIGKGSGG